VGASQGSTAAVSGGAPRTAAVLAGGWTIKKWLSTSLASSIEEHGIQAVCVLRHHADRAATEGDHLSAQTWLDIADAAERLLGGVGG
jgi:hypothetical protein